MLVGKGDAIRSRISRIYHSRMMEPGWIKFRNSLGMSYEVLYKHNQRNEISELCAKYGSDKGAPLRSKDFHGYSDFYLHLFSLRKNDVKLIFECGLGTNNLSLPSNMGVNGRPGASLRVWRDFFPYAEVFGADIDRDILFVEDRIRTCFVDQTSPSSIQDMWEVIDRSNFDIMIDDGLHEADAAIILLEHSFSKLRDGGIYIIEDLDHRNLGLVTEHLSKHSYNFTVIRFDSYDIGPLGGFLAVIHK